MYEDYGYLIHSAKGTTWTKKGTKYVSKKKVNGKWRYVYKERSKMSPKDVIDKKRVKKGFASDSYSDRYNAALDRDKANEEIAIRDRQAASAERTRKANEMRTKTYKIKNKIGSVKKKVHDIEMKKYSKDQVKKMKKLRKV